MITSLALIARPQLVAFFAARRGGRLPNPRFTAVATVVTGVVLGFLVSISSVGAGAVGVTALVLLYPAMPVLRIVGTDIAHAVPLTLVAGMGHWMIGSVDWLLLVSLLLGSLPGIVIGSHFSPKVPERILRPLLAGVLILVGLKLLLS
ncbi:Sulfite exporter TauE/SafE [Methylobrevis pamukkalensis]|uniref:Probable membrane transporter protein n=1 Tax=Methylobrevis pamukkalensis TaxID=1439726 RepID=A0A1E3H2P3_9HYPH|nr:Sulfite exporter TauE/SafE [Methylobrevis pamukkalensis]